REETAALDRELPVYGIRSMETILATSPGVAARRVLTTTFTGFAVLALVLGAIGLFGVVAHDVATRRSELALRIALGADPARILLATFGQGATVVGLGVVAGGVMSVWSIRALNSVMPAAVDFNVPALAVAALILIVAGAGAVLPVARR